MSIAETLQELEASLLTNAVRKDGARVSELLAEEFCEFGKSGRVYFKEETVAALQVEDEMRISMKEFACRPIAEGAMLVTYRSVHAANDGVMVEALRSSLWVFREERWQMLFHQGTRVDAA